MKKDIHPEYGTMQVTLSTGETVEMSSVLGAKEGYSMKLDVDSHNHPAYTKSKDQFFVGSSQRNKFDDRFSGMFGAKPAKKEEKAEETTKEDVKA